MRKFFLRAVSWFRSIPKLLGIRWREQRLRFECLFDESDPVVRGKRRKKQNRLEKAFLKRCQRMAKRSQTGRSVAAILAIDLSSSISGIPAEYAKGYQRFINSLRDHNPNLILIGFHHGMELLYEGPVLNAPNLTEAHFTPDSKECLLGVGTALYRSVFFGALLASLMSKFGPTTVFWLTDGLDTMFEIGDHVDISAASGMCESLWRADIPYQVIGVKNPCFSGFGISLEQVLTKLNRAGRLPKSGRTPMIMDSVSAFGKVGSLILERIAASSTTEKESALPNQE